MVQLFKFVDWKFRCRAAGRAGQAALAVMLWAGGPATAQAQPAAPPREGGPTLSGYMEMHLNKVQDQPTAVDLHRFVLMVGHSFSDRLKFWSEVEVEHALVAVEGGVETGEVAIEQAYIDLLVGRRFNLRAGMVLVDDVRQPRGQDEVPQEPGPQDEDLFHFYHFNLSSPL